MYTLLILFFGSLLGIMFMIGRKLFLLSNGQLHISERRENFFRIPNLEEWKHLIVQKMKVLGHASLVETIRLYIRSANFLTRQHERVKITIRYIRHRRSKGELPDKSEQREASGFLKRISEYKKKVREIKHRIREEESL